MRIHVLPIIASVFGFILTAGCTIGVAAVPPGGEGEGEGGAEGEGEGGAAGTACAVLQSRCASCHSNGQFAPDIGAAAVTSGALVGAASSVYPSETYIVANDAASSFLFKKITGAQAGTEGATMPIGVALSAAEQTLVSDWINAGAPTTDCDGAVIPPPNDPVVESAIPSRFGTTPPAGDYSGAPCSTGQYWTGGEAESGHMRPGDDCRGCHIDRGEGPLFAMMGTVFTSLTDGTNCRGLAPSNYQVLVDIMDSDGNVAFTLPGDSAGNFYGPEFGSAPNPFRAQVRLEANGVTVATQVMQSEQTEGSCNTCHTEDARGPIIQNIPLGRITISP